MISALLKKKKIKASVADETWDMAGTLSQMRLAGVKANVVNKYIDLHQSTASQTGAELALTEVQVRDDLAKYQKERKDKDYIPVISIGYRGGFNNDLTELIEQQEHILETYNKADRYVIIGLVPENWEDPANYEKTMRKKWGEHYLSLTKTISYLDFSDAQRQQIAEAVFDKLVKLKYI